MCPFLSAALQATFAIIRARFLSSILLACTRYSTLLKLNETGSIFPCFAKYLQAFKSPLIIFAVCSSR